MNHAALLILVCAVAPLTAADPPYLGMWQEDTHADDLMHLEPARVTFQSPGEAPQYFCAAYDPDGLIWIRNCQIYDTVKVKFTGDRLEIVAGGYGTYHRLATVVPGLETAAFTIPADKPVNDDRKAAIIAEVAKRAATAQAVHHDPVHGLYLCPADADNEAWIKTVITEVGWPDAGRFGRETAANVFMFVEHSNDLPLMLGALPCIEKDLPSQAVKAQDYATLFDYVLMQSGRPQRYGTQIIHDEYNHPAVWFLEDRAQVEQIRNDHGLIPLVAYLQIVGNVTGTTIGYMDHVRFDLSLKNKAAETTHQ